MTPRIPDGYLAHWAYAPPLGDDSTPWLAYLFERRYAQIGRAVSVLGGLVMLAGGALYRFRGGTLPNLVVLLGLFIAVAGPAVQLLGGRAGFHVLAEDGSVGQRLGRDRSDVQGRARIRVHGNVIDG